MDNGTVGVESHQIHPLRDLLTELIEEFLPEDLDIAISLSKEQLGSWYDECYESKKTQRFFDILEKQLGTNVVPYLKNLTNKMNFHIDLGSKKVARLFEEYEKNVEERKQFGEEFGFQLDENFVGRSKYIQEISHILTENTCSTKTVGIIICGMGGMGKTTLAHQVCFQLRHSKQVYKIDLREKRRMTELFVGVLRALDQVVSDENYQQLRSLFMKHLNDIKKETIFLLDNVDDILSMNEDDFLNTLQFACEHLSVTENHKIKFIITSRQKLPNQQEKDNQTLNKRITRFGGKMVEFELTSLEPEESVELFKRCTQLIPVEEESARDIVKLCNYTPLAINVVAKWMSNSHWSSVSADQVIEKLKLESNSLTNDDQMRNCLKQPFGSLSRDYQKWLMQLSVFQSAPFDVDGVKTVLNIELERDAKLKMLFFKSRHLIEIDDMEQIGDEEKDIDAVANRKSVTKYSFHPFIASFLKGEQKVFKFIECLNEAKERFFTYCQKILYRAGKASNKNCLTCLKILEDNKPHIMAFFKSLEKQDASPHSENIENKAMTMLHVSCITSRYLSTYDQIALFERQADRAFTDDKSAEYIFFKAQQGECFLRIELTSKAEVVMKDMDENFVKLKYPDDKMEKLATVFYYLFKGRLCRRQEQFLEAIKSMKRAKEEVKNLDKTRHMLTVNAEISNSIGCVYFQMKEHATALTYHQQALDMTSKHVENSLHFSIPHYMSNIGAVLHEIGALLLESPEKQEDGIAKLQEAKKWYDDSLKHERRLNTYGFGATGGKLGRKAEVCRLLEEFETALHCAKEASSIGRRTFYPPHTEVTIGLYRIAKVLHQMSKKAEKENDPENAFNYDSEARAYYDETLRNIKWGGLKTDHKDYAAIKREHFEVMTNVGMQSKLEKLRKTYEDFENGKYTRRARRTFQEVEDHYKRANQEDNSEHSHSSSTSDDDEDDFYFDTDMLKLRHDSGCDSVSFSSSMASFRESLTDDLPTTPLSASGGRGQFRFPSTGSVDDAVFK